MELGITKAYVFESLEPETINEPDEIETIEEPVTTEEPTKELQLA